MQGAHLTSLSVREFEAFLEQVRPGISSSGSNAACAQRIIDWENHFWKEQRVFMNVTAALGNCLMARDVCALCNFSSSRLRLTEEA